MSEKLSDFFHDMESGGALNQYRPALAPRAIVGSLDGASYLQASTDIGNEVPGVRIVGSQRNKSQKRVGAYYLPGRPNDKHGLSVMTESVEMLYRPDSDLPLSISAGFAQDRHVLPNDLPSRFPNQFNVAGNYDENGVWKSINVSGGGFSLPPIFIDDGSLSSSHRTTHFDVTKIARIFSTTDIFNLAINPDYNPDTMTLRLMRLERLIHTSLIRDEKFKTELYTFPRIVTPVSLRELFAKAVDKIFDQVIANTETTSKYSDMD